VARDELLVVLHQPQGVQFCEHPTETRPLSATPKEIVIGMDISCKNMFCNFVPLFCAPPRTQ
jgi:hypothetical protein